MLDLLAGIFVVHFFALVTPGPDTLLTIRSSLLYSKRQSIFAALGIAFGVIVWSFLVILGLNAFLIAYPRLNLILHIFGIVFLSYLAFSLIRDLKNAEMQKDVFFDKKIPAKNLFITGLLTNLANPKALLYFTLVFGSLIPIGNLDLQIYALILVTIETFLWFAFVGISFSNIKIRRFYFAKRKILDLSSAGVFAFFVILLLVDLLIK